MIQAEQLPFGATIGILGGGQLGRMSALSAVQLGYKTHIFSPDADGPGMDVASRRTIAQFSDTDALLKFAASVDVVSFETENIPVSVLEVIAPLVPCRPGVNALRICQDRLAEKIFFESINVPVAPWWAVHSSTDLRVAVAEVGLPAVLKTTRMGYDGRGQAVVRSMEDAEAAFHTLAPHPLVLEALIPFVREISAIAARGMDGSVVVYDAVENVHRHHILDLSFAPARIAPEAAAVARTNVARVAVALDLVGLVALEMFMLEDGTLIGNEIAPRPHNSGHWTMDACQASQFNLYIRAITGMPLIEPVRHSDVVMKNLVGPAGAAFWPVALGQSDLVPHWYGKAELRAGRKLGHVSQLLPLGGLAGWDSGRMDF